MTPFGTELNRILQARKVRHGDLATGIGVHPTYLSAVINGRKGLPGEQLIANIALTLQLSVQEHALLAEAARESCRQLELPLVANVAERRVAARLVESMGRLLPAQLEAISNVLALTPGGVPVTATFNRKTGVAAHEK